METQIKITYRGGMPPEDLLTVSPGHFKVHLYECNRSQLRALINATSLILAAMPATDTTPDKAFVMDLMICTSRAPEDGTDARQIEALQCAADEERRAKSEATN